MEQNARKFLKKDRIRQEKNASRAPLTPTDAIKLLCDVGFVVEEGAKHHKLFHPITKASLIISFRANGSNTLSKGISVVIYEILEEHAHYRKSPRRL